MSESNELVQAGLIEAGVPELLVAKSTHPLEDVELKKRYINASLIMQEFPVIFVYGADSPLKELLCVKLMRRYMFRNNKTGRWLTPARIGFGEQIKPAGIVTVIGIDLLAPNQAKILSQTVRDWLPMGRAFIFASSTSAKFSEIFGQDLFAYLSHYATSFLVSSESVKIAEV